MNLPSNIDPVVLATIARVVVILILGLPLVGFVSQLVARMVGRRFSAQSTMVARQSVRYAGVILVLVMAMREAGFNLSALLGAAGVAGIAVGFAAQTSLSNVISGIFLVSEQPFRVGDVIQIGDTTGIVLGIDLLSVKLRKFDNLFVRIPNETLVKSEVVNLTRFPIRRMDFTIGVAYKEDIERVLAVIREVIDANPLVLDEPEAALIFNNFGGSALEIFVGIWFAKENYFAVRNTFLTDIKKRFNSEGIEIPFPHHSLYTGAVTEPFPIRLVGGESVGAALEGSERQAGGPHHET